MHRHERATTRLPAAVASLLAAASLLVAAPAVAQDAAPRAGAAAQADAAWLPLLGCWIPAGEGDEAGLLCARPAADGPGLELVSVSETEEGAVSREVVRTIVADGVARPVRHEGCEGTERVERSADGDRLYLRSDLVCEGDVRRTSTGVISFPSPGQWLDVEAVEVEGRSVAWVRWYREAPAALVREAGFEHVTADREMAVRAARVAASRRLSVDDVIEATRAVDAEAVRALVAELGAPFTLNAERLVALDEAGVPGDVIDVMVAVTYPETFALADEGAEAEARPSDPARRVYVDQFYSPYDPYYSGYYRGLYSPWRWGYWTGSYPGYGRGYRPTVVVVEPRDHGRVVKGRGYTGGGSGSDTGRRARPRGESGAAPSAGSSRGGSVSPAGTRSGSGSSSTGRRAKPRSGGGGGEGGGSGGEGGEGGGSGF